MISRSHNYIEYCRETAANLKTLHDLALRGTGKEQITHQIHERIVREVNLRPEDDLIDIGCGDGTLLRMAENLGVCNAVGLLATDEEVAILRKTGLNVRQGLTDKLPLPDTSASVIVCNSVFLVVPAERIPASLREICRIAKPGARIFIGEVPFVPGPTAAPEFSTARETLSYLYRKHGLRTCIGMLRRMIYWKSTGQPMVIRDGTQISFCASAEEFVLMGQDAGLQFVRYWQHNHPTTRNNYLFQKTKE